MGGFLNKDGRDGHLAKRAAGITPNFTHSRQAALRTMAGGSTKLSGQLRRVGLTRSYTASIICDLWKSGIGMQINVNGKQREVGDGTTVQQLLKELELKGPVAVELNRRICSRNSHADTILNGGDVVEIVTIVGGG